MPAVESIRIQKKEIPPERVSEIAVDTINVGYPKRMVKIIMGKPIKKYFGWKGITMACPINTLA